MSTDEKFYSGMKVIYIPEHAKGDKNHPDCERGTVTAWNEKFVFVKFARNTTGLGKACRPENLVSDSWY